MTDREALLRCRQPVAYSLGSWKRWLKKHSKYSVAKTAAVMAQIKELQALLDHIDGRVK